MRYFASNSFTKNIEPGRAKMNSKKLPQWIFVLIITILLLAGCSGQVPVQPTETVTPIPPIATNTLVPPTATNTPVPPTAINTPFPTQTMSTIEQQLFKDTLVFIKQKYDVNLELIETGYLSMDGGQNYTDLMVKVKCMSADCTSGKLYE